MVLGLGLDWDDTFADYGATSERMAALANTLRRIGKKVATHQLMGELNTARKLKAFWETEEKIDSKPSGGETSLSADVCFLTLCRDAFDLPLS